MAVEGSVRKAGNQLRITAQASETESGHHLWSQTFARELNDVFAIQEEIAQRVGGLLRVHMPEARPRVHVSARDLEAETGSRVHASYRDLEAYIRYVKARVLIYQFVTGLLLLSRNLLLTSKTAAIIAPNRLLRAGFRRLSRSHV